MTNANGRPEWPDVTPYGDRPAPGQPNDEALKLAMLYTERILAALADPSVVNAVLGYARRLTVNRMDPSGANADAVRSELVGQALTAAWDRTGAIPPRRERLK